MKFKKFSAIIKIFWQRALTYRAVVFAYRIGEIGVILFMIAMWSAIYRHTTDIGGFSLNEMITYILIGNLVDVLTRNWSTHVIAQDIRTGMMSIYIIRPLRFFWWSIFNTIGRTSFPFIMSLATQLLVMAFFYKRIVYNQSPAVWAVLIVMIFFAFIIQLLMNYLIGLIAFWTIEVDGIFTSIDRLKKFFSGSYFPLSLLPVAYVNVSFILPFAYSFFVPAQLYLNKIDISVGLKGLAIQAIWILLLYWIIKFVWKRGLRRYEGVGI